MSTPGTRKSASFDSRPPSSSRTAPPTTYASSPSEPTYSSSALDEGDRLDLDEGAGRELRDLDRRPGGRRVTDVLRVHLVHAGEVVEVLEEHRRLHDTVERAAGGFEDRAQVCEDLLGLRADLAAHQLGLPRLQSKLPRDEDEPVRLDRLRVRSALERGRRRFRPNNLLRHESSLESGTGRHACPSAAPTALKIAASTCCGSVPSTSRTCRLSPAARASSSRNREATSVARPPTRWSEKSTLVTSRGSGSRSRAASASASSAGMSDQPSPAFCASSGASDAPSARPAAPTASSALPGATSSESLKRAVSASSPTRWSSTGRPVATLATPCCASWTRTPVCVSGMRA